MTLQNHQEKIRTKQEKRESARIVAEFIDLHRSTGKEWSRIYSGTKKEVDHAKNHLTLIKNTHYKNALAKKIIQNSDYYQTSLLKNNISIDTVKKSAEQFDAQKSFNIDEAAKKAAQKMTGIDRKIVEIKAKNKEKDHDIER